MFVPSFMNRASSQTMRPPPSPQLVVTSFACVRGALTPLNPLVIPLTDHNGRRWEHLKNPDLMCILAGSRKVREAVDDLKVVEHFVKLRLITSAVLWGKHACVMLSHKESFNPLPLLGALHVDWGWKKYTTETTPSLEIMIKGRKELVEPIASSVKPIEELILGSSYYRAWFSRHNELDSISAEINKVTP